jgi:hypothetical protein
MLVYCCRHTELCGSYDESDIESSGSRRSVEKSSIGNTPSVSGGRGQYASPVQNSTNSPLVKKHHPIIIFLHS